MLIFYFNTIIYVLFSIIRKKNYNYRLLFFLFIVYCLLLLLLLLVTLNTSLFKIIIIIIKKIFCLFIFESISICKSSKEVK